MPPWNTLKSHSIWGGLESGHPVIAYDLKEWSQVK